MAVRNRASLIQRLQSIEEVSISFLFADGTPAKETRDSEAYDTPLSGPKIQQAMLHSHSLLFRTPLEIARSLWTRWQVRRGITVLVALPNAVSESQGRIRCGALGFF
jgi:hypothetical protein